MGWKSFSIFIQPAGEPGFVKPATFDERATEELSEAIAPGRYRRAGSENLFKAIYPKKRALYLASYGPAAVICEQDIAAAFFTGRKHLWRNSPSAEAAAARNRILSLFPDREIVVLVLHSVVNLWGFAVFRDGMMVRCAAGASDDGIICDSGSPLPEEESLLAQKPLAQLDEEGDGETLVFEVSRRLFAKPLNQVDLSDLTSFVLARYATKRSGLDEWFRSLIGR